MWMDGLENTEVCSVKDYSFIHDCSTTLVVYIYCNHDNKCPVSLST